MDEHEERRQKDERILRRAEAAGIDPQRVARAIRYRPSPPVEMQEVVEVERSRSFGVRLARVARRPFGR